MATNTLPQPRSEKNVVINVVLWALQIGVAFMFLKVAIPKLMSDPTAVQGFGAIGAGQWFRYFTGALEVAGAIGLLIPKLSGYAALLLSVVMVGAIVTHLAILGGSPMMAAILLAVNLGIAWARLVKRI